MKRPRLLDLFCCAGSAARGYEAAGFEVVGVDIEPQPNYPFEFHQADALTFPLSGFDAIHASPPCQAFSLGSISAGTRHKHPDLIEPTRRRLSSAGVPWVMENVPGAPLQAPAKLCGAMFGLPLVRIRHFESSFYLLTPAPLKRETGRDFICLAGNARKKGQTNAVALQALGLPSGVRMTRYEINQAIPPAYTAFIGRQLMQQVRAA